MKKQALKKPAEEQGNPQGDVSYKPQVPGEPLNMDEGGIVPSMYSEEDYRKQLQGNQESPFSGIGNGIKDMASSLGPVALGAVENVPVAGPLVRRGISMAEQENAPPVKAAAMNTPEKAAPAPAPVQKYPGVPPAANTDLENQLGGYKAQIEKYGPDQQMEVEKALLKGRTGLGSNLAQAGGGLADAIMQGVARAGNPGFQEKITNQQNGLANELTGAMKGAHEQGVTDIKAEMELSQQDPNSPLSKVAQNTEGPTLIQLGLKPDQIKLMPASLIGDLLGKKITLADALARIEETAAYQKGMIGVRQQEVNLNKNKLGIEHPLSSLIFGGSSNGAQTQAQSFDTEEQAAAAGLPDGTPIVVGGVHGTWRH